MSKKKEEYENRNEPCVKDVFVVNENLAYSGCKFTKMMVATYRDVKHENLTMIDLENIVIQDIKENPTPYVNSKSSLGKELRNAIKATKAEAALNAVKDDSKPADITLNPDNGKGLFTAISDPYRDENGNTMQDTVTLSTPATNSSIATPSGTLGQASSGGSGVSQIKIMYLLFQNHVLIRLLKLGLVKIIVKMVKAVLLLVLVVMVQVLLQAKGMAIRQKLVKMFVKQILNH